MEKQIIKTELSIEAYVVPKDQLLSLIAKNSSDLPNLRRLSTTVREILDEIVQAAPTEQPDVAKVDSDDFPYDISPDKLREFKLAKNNIIQIVDKIKKIENALEVLNDAKIQYEFGILHNENIVEHCLV